MWGYEEGLALAPEKTVRSLIYDYDPETMHEAAEARVRVDSPQRFQELYAKSKERVLLLVNRRGVTNYLVIKG